MGFDFYNKTPDEIASQITAMVDAEAGMADVTQVFEAVGNLPRDKQSAAMDKLEESLIKIAKEDGAAWAKATAALSDNLGDEQAMAELLALREDMGHLRPLAQALLKIYAFKRLSSAPWTEAIRDEYVKFSDNDRKSIDKLAELFADTYDKLENNGAEQATVKPVILPQWTDIIGVLNKDGATSAIAKLESFDKATQANLINSLEKDFMYAARKMFENGKRVSVADYREDKKNLADTLAFATYLAKVKGAAANPQLDLYLDAISTVLNGQPENFSDLASVLPAVISHRNAADNQQTLKTLSQARKARTAGLRT